MMTDLDLSKLKKVATVKTADWKHMCIIAKDKQKRCYLFYWENGDHPIESIIGDDYLTAIVNELVAAATIEIEKRGLTLWSY